MSLSLTRKQFLGAAGGGLSATPAAAARRPAQNVVILVSDQHRPGALGWTGDPYSRTPNLDRLASSGTSFQAAYCANPVCAPSRASLLTGLYCHHHGVYNNDVPWRADLQTIAHHFARAGYFNALIGKAHFGDAQAHGFDYRLDFNDWYQYLGPKTQLYVDEINAPNGGCGLPQVPKLWESGDPWKGKRSPGAEEAIVVGRPSIMEEADHFDAFVARESIRFLKSYAGKRPLLLIAAFLKPHAPFTPAARFIDPNWQRSIKLPETYGKVDLASVPAYIRARITQPNQWARLLTDPERGRKRLAMYYGSVTHVDHCVGEVLDTLRETGLQDDTAVVYTSDHGCMCGEHGLWDKTVFYESSAGVPLIVRAPGLTRAGSVCPAPVSQVSLLPTLLELCSLPIPAGLDGPSLAPLLRDPSLEQHQPAYSQSLMGSPSPLHMIRRGDWKYCYCRNDMAELYNLKQDPHEMHNLAGSSGNREILNRLHAELLAWLGPLNRG